MKINPCEIVVANVDAALAHIPDSSIDLVIADPPYGMAKAEWDMRPDYGPWIAEVMRVLAPKGTAYIFGKPEIIAAHWLSFPE